MNNLSKLSAKLFVHLVSLGFRYLRRRIGAREFALSIVQKVEIHRMISRIRVIGNAQAYYTTSPTHMKVIVQTVLSDAPRFHISIQTAPLRCHAGEQSAEKPFVVSLNERSSTLDELSMVPSAEFQSEVATTRCSTSTVIWGKFVDSTPATVDSTRIVPSLDRAITA
eukprot:CCRYP_019397-RE/>CCRYP_019397-RE protein AED:0.42 eAED:0.42 QI:0/0/0/1/1/1/2/0/166